MEVRGSEGAMKSTNERSETMEKIKWDELHKNNIYNMDFRDGLEMLRKKFGGGYTIITDPPYNIGFKYDNYSDDMDYYEYLEMISELQEERLAIIHYPEETIQYFSQSLGVPDEVNVWCYNSNLPGRQSRLINYYNMVPNYNNVLQPYKNPDDARIQERIKNGKTGARSYDWFSDIQLMKNVEKTDIQHPCPVPVELMERIILLTTEKGDLVVDPFMGSGTTAIACIRTGREYIGFELSEKYCGIAKQRIEKELRYGSIPMALNL